MKATATLLSFVEPKDPFMPSEVAGEERSGPILLLMDARLFDSLFLFHTPHTRENAEMTRAEVARRYPHCQVSVQELPVSDPKDYSSIMGHLAHHVRNIVQLPRHTEHYVCVSSGTAEIRAAWFLLKAVGVLPATLLQVGSPSAWRLGRPDVKEVRLDGWEWASLRELVMPLEYFRRGPEPSAPRDRLKFSLVDKILGTGADAGARAPAAPQPEEWKERTMEFGPPSDMVEIELEGAPAPLRFPELDDAMQELDIFIGSAVMRAAAERAAIAALWDGPVLLQGETGTGKELFAKLIHRLSIRHGQPLVAINCAAIPRDLVESHLFGHVKGAFTGATHDQAGKFNQAHGGTLFFDEVGELPLEAQAKLLRVLQDGEVEPLGSNSPRKVDVRLVAATNRNLLDEVRAGRFREDLYYRLEVVQIHLAPLRERCAEIPELAVMLLKRINYRRKKGRQLSKEALLRLEQHNWPGNVRELSNVLERSVLYSQTDVLAPNDLAIVKSPAADDLGMLPQPGPGFSLEEFLAQARKQLIIKALVMSNNNQTAAAEVLGLSKQAVSKFVNEQLGKQG